MEVRQAGVLNLPYVVNAVYDAGMTPRNPVRARELCTTPSCAPGYLIVPYRIVIRSLLLNA
jgi:hypothetical protein